ncbi:P27 family phage terminase small subunit [Bradyrhizobium sp. 151]|uniref:P27 family phage terminase small subunit n=1 Tax=Bradyrhizobium sp. 151 TaxID=2782626 RepID=UPI001FFA406F|nr:P27 family phage terminase small subunit [Bradyrhizobium sp. 151]MCK1657125.1 P27 family phage terminase small subunit [Bradyrhizobium sp. 151]
MTPNKSIHKPPAHFSKSTKMWWRSVVSEYQLEPHHLRLLQAACEAWDRLQQSRELLLRDGLVVEGREGGMRPHPAVAIERDCRIGFSRLVRELDLDVEPPASSPRRPPALVSNRGRA